MIGKLYVGYQFRSYVSHMFRLSYMNNFIIGRQGVNITAYTGTDLRTVNHSFNTLKANLNSFFIRQYRNVTQFLLPINFVAILYA